MTDAQKCPKCGNTSRRHEQDGLECMEWQLAQAREREATEKARADKAEAALPATFYAGESLDFRIARMVEIWNRAIEATKEAEADNAEYKRHLDNALRQAKEVCPDYPWTASPTMSEIAWAICSSLRGVGLACGDWRAEAKRLLAIVERYREHLRRMQADATTYLIPDRPDCGRDWFISRILWHLDGPQERAIEALAEKEACDV